MSRYMLFLLAMLFSALAQILLSGIQIPQKLALPYLTKRCLKYYLGRQHLRSFDKGFRVQFSIFSEIKAYKSVAYEIKSVYPHFGVVKHNQTYQT